MERICRVTLILQFLFLFHTGKSLCQQGESKNEFIKIGLLISDSGSSAAVNGSELAIREANEKGGLNGRQFQLITRSMEGPWGTGAREAVSLIFDYKVWALLGSHNGRNAHIAEQAATKATVVFISAWAGDPTLSQAFVPWFFNCVPNDNQQAESLAEEIYTNRKFKKVFVVTCNDYDAKSATDCFLRKVKNSGSPEPVVFSYDTSAHNPGLLSEKIIKARAECVLLFCPPEISVRIAAYFLDHKLNLPLFGSMMILNEDILSQSDFLIYDNILSVPSGKWPDQTFIPFREKYRKSYQKDPGMVAAYAYDGMRVLLDALINAGTDDLELIQKELKSTRVIGVTGIIQFDDRGNRAGKCETSLVRNGVPATSE